MTGREPGGVTGLKKKEKNKGGERMGREDMTRGWIEVGQEERLRGEGDVWRDG